MKTNPANNSENINPAHILHLLHLKKMAAKLCKHFGIEPECFTASSYLFRRSGPTNVSAIYHWLNRHYGAEDQWGAYIDFDDCAQLLRHEFVKHISDHDIGEILM